MALVFFSPVSTLERVFVAGTQVRAPVATAYSSRADAAKPRRDNAAERYARTGARDEVQECCY